MKELADFAKPQIEPPLHPRLRPAVLANQAYLKAVRESGRAVPLVIGLERHQGHCSVFRTHCFGEGSDFARLNLPYAERLVKMLLWQRGGWRVVIGGPRSIGEHIQRVYSAGGVRAFDAEFMAGVYEQPFTVEIADAGAVREPSEGTVSLGGHLDGCRLGFDLGATDRKVAAVL